jgi:hypothetical protein
LLARSPNCISSRSRTVEYLDGADELADLAGAAAGVGPQGAADGAGHADERLQPAQVVPRGRGDQRRNRRPGAGVDAFAVDPDGRERRLAQPQYRAADALVADQQVAAAAQYAERHAFGEAAPHDGRQLVARPGLHQHLGRSTELEVRVRRQRLLALDDFFEVGEGNHVLLPGR